MAVTTWYFVEDEQGQMNRTPVTRMDRFFDGSEMLPHAAGAVRAAEVTISVSNRQIQAVHRVLWLKLAVDDHGRCDQRARAEYAQLAVEHTALVDLEASVVPLGSAIAGQRILREYWWQPTDEHLGTVARSLNDHALRAPVVVIQGRRLHTV